MMSNPRGIALIINNEVFSPSADLKDRQGSEKDVEALERMFKALYFEVNIERNLGKEKILQVLDKLAKSDHTAYDCFVLCLMSHGQEGLFYGSDGQAVPFDTVCDLFSNSNCRTLRGKPKLMFIQACRGTEGQTGVVNDSPFSPGPQQPAQYVMLTEGGISHSKGLCLIIQTFCWLIQRSITMPHIDMNFMEAVLYVVWKRCFEKRQVMKMS